MISYSHNKYHYSAYTEQFISKQCIIMNDDTSSYTLSIISLLKLSHVDRSAFTDDSELNVESLIENLKNRIIFLLNSIKIVKEIIMSFAMHEVVMFTDIKKLFTTVKFNITEISALMNFFRIIDLYQSIL
ncbi:hypothetical protein BDDG_12143 [Blastomyces dermatitidis ATCC 18188]|uniref:Uncharacterized protein n=1 Tax=Ajellomyces dermatitidis (strain ATCC 18188 / CBS 674.68) TaxID=653446 RepID=A0A0J9EN21_AJEDA|nr:hypothetical protein BDDG_12143 [Blastomyces dermatitidis ATCC 18188]